MLEQLRGFFSALSGEEKKETASDFADDDPRLAAGALMYHVIQADGILRDVESRRLVDVLSEEYSLHGDDLKALVEASREADSAAVDLYRFTRVLMNNLSEEQRIGFIELLWEMVYADGHRHELEDNIVWRVSELLGVSGRDRVLMRQRVQTKYGFTVDPEGPGDP